MRKIVVGIVLIGIVLLILIAPASDDQSTIVLILRGIFSSAFLAAILRVTTPILLPSLGALISDRAGVINIGLEGTMLAAAFTGATVGAQLQNAFAGFIAGMIVGVLVALLLAFFHLHLNGDLILGGIAINILCSAATIAIGYQIAGGSGGLSTSKPVQIPTVQLDFLRSIPVAGEALYAIIGSQNIMIWIAFILVATIWFLMYRMPFGKHLRAVGENPDAAASVGINVRRVRYIALGLSGLLAGLGGIHLSMGYTTFGFTRDMSAGRGFIALVAPALGNGTPVGTMLAAVLFGAFAALETRLPSLLPNITIPSQLPQMIPFAATIIALVVYSIQRQRSAAARVRRFEQQFRQVEVPAGSAD
jgi:simple sugar transport system permease protein